MTLEAWMIFASFWVIFVTTPGPNAVNCIATGMEFGFARGLWGVLGILTQAMIFLTLSALGVTALLLASPSLFEVARLLGAALLIWLGVRGWVRAARPIETRGVSEHHIFGRAFLIATVNAKSVAGYFAAFSQFIQPEPEIWVQMKTIVPTALAITALSYSGYTALGAWMGQLAIGAILNVWVRRLLALCFIAYGVALALLGLPAQA